VIFDYLWALLTVCVEQLILSHAYDEYLVWHKNRVWQVLILRIGLGNLDAAKTLINTSKVMYKTSTNKINQKKLLNASQIFYQTSYECDQKNHYKSITSTKKIQIFWFNDSKSIPAQPARRRKMRLMARWGDERKSSVQKFHRQQNRRGTGENYEWVNQSGAQAGDRASTVPNTKIENRQNRNAGLPRRSATQENTRAWPKLGSLFARGALLASEENGPAQWQIKLGAVCCAKIKDSSED
jgi:hypothetical protein